MNATHWFILFVVVQVAVYDVWAIQHYGPEYSISKVLHNVCAQWPIVAVLLGVLIGHVFWPLR